jgi:cell filamentation protein
MNKGLICCFDDQEVCAVRDNEKSKWWFSLLDIVGVLRGEEDYPKNKNYLKYLRAKLKKDGSELVSRATQLQLTATDSNHYVVTEGDINV